MVAPKTASARRGTSSSRALVALGAVALLGLLAAAVLLVGGAFGDRTAISASARSSAVVAAQGQHQHDDAQTISAIRQQLSTRARSAAFAVLVPAAVGVACAYCRARPARADQPSARRVAGLPPGRAPPALRIV